VLWRTLVAIFCNSLCSYCQLFIHKFNPNPHGYGILENGNKSCMTDIENVLKIENASQNISADFFVKGVSTIKVIFNELLMIF
jgi:hypothetical protein